MTSGVPKVGAILWLLALGRAVAAESFFATSVLTYANGPGVTPGQGFGIEELVLGGPRGAGEAQGSLDVLTLGEGGSVVVGFGEGLEDRFIFDGPGADFIVFENPFYVGGNPDAVFAELVFVEVSSDGENFARFATFSQTPSLVGLYGAIDPADVSGFAGVGPVHANVVSGQIDPFDPAQAGGDAFDLADLAGHPLVQAGVVRLAQIRYVRLIDVIGDGREEDSAGDPIYDPTGLFNAADIDAVAVIHGRICSPDLDGDGDVDGGDLGLFVAAMRGPGQAGGDSRADLDGDGDVDLGDLDRFARFFAQGPP